MGQEIKPVIIPSINDFDNFTEGDYYDTEKPYELMANLIEYCPARKTQLIDRVCKIAAKQGVGKFRQYFRDWAKEHSNNKLIQESIQNNVTEFFGQPIELFCGKFNASDDGITTTDRQGNEVEVCPHPILPIQRLENIDTNETKFRVAYSRGKDRLGRTWKPPIIFDAVTLFNSNKVTELGRYGIVVNSESSKYLSTYFSTIDGLNYDTLPTKASVGRLGWIKDTAGDIIGFAPYIDNVEFDGAEQFKEKYECVKPFGDYDLWKDTISEIRGTSLYADIMMASSVASVLVEPCGCLPFFVHLWGGTEAGKTVGLMYACSVWANPDVGNYITTFNTTTVGQELNAAFCNSLPLIMDELQIQSSNGKKDFDNTIYFLTEGVGKTRGKKEGGVDKTKKWKNCILTTGEFPISNDNSGGGSLNRTIELDCKDTKLFEHPNELCSVLTKNYGHLGKIIIEELEKDNFTLLERVIEYRKDIYKQLTETGQSTDKQCSSASLIIAASWLINEVCFHDGKVITIDDMLPFLTRKEDVSQNQRAMASLNDWIGTNYLNFITENNPTPMTCYGKISYDKDTGDKLVHIFKDALNKWARDNGFNSKALVSWAVLNRKMLVSKSRYNDHACKINGEKQWLYCFIFEKIEDEDDMPESEPDFDDEFDIFE